MTEPSTKIAPPDEQSRRHIPEQAGPVLPITRWVSHETKPEFGGANTHCDTRALVDDKSLIGIMSPSRSAPGRQGWKDER